MSIFTCKPVEELLRHAETSSQHSFKRSLGIFSLAGFGVGGAVGAGIFVLTGTIASNFAGPAVSLSFLLASIVCMLAGLCYAELAAMIPVTGSAYSYSYATMGEGVAWLVGWNLMLEWLFSGSLVAIGWSGYVTSALADAGFPLPRVISHSPIDFPDGHTLVFTGGWIDLPAVLVTLFCTVVLLLGTRGSALMNNIIVAIKVSAILAVIVCGIFFVDTANWHPFIPPATGASGSYGWSGVVRGAAIAFFAYLGFDGIATLAQETKSPQRSIPIGLAVSLGICTLLYVLVSLVITGMANYHDLGVPDPIYVALSHAGPKLAWLKYIVGVAAFLGLLSVILASLLGQIRIFYAMARDGLIPQAFGRIHPRWRTPHIGTLITGIAAAFAAGLLPLGLLGELISIGTLMAFATVCAGVPILRKRMPDANRPFKVPLNPWLPIAGIAACLYLMFGLPPDTWIRLVVWLGVGIAVYWLYGRKHSKLATQQTIPAV